MLRETTVTYLEMTSPGQLIAGRPPPTSLALDRLGSDGATEFRGTCLRIGAPHGWSSRPQWPQERWVARLRNPDVGAWLVRVGDETAGLIELEAQAGGDVEIAVFGLVPEFVGRGFGGHLLTVATEMAWGFAPPDGNRTERVWVHTSSHDHPHALENYRSRGFRTFRVDHRREPRSDGLADNPNVD